MKTYKTTRGIEFDLEVIEVGYKSIKVQATCEEGSNTFTIGFPYPIKEDNTFYGELSYGDTSQLTDEDLEEVMSWVDEVTVSFITSELCKVCVAKSILDEYWAFNIFHHNVITANVHKMKITQDGGFENIQSLFAHGETEIKELINKLKK